MMDMKNRMTRTFATATLLLLLMTAFAGTANAQRETPETCDDAGGVWIDDRRTCYFEETREVGDDKAESKERIHFDERECLALRERAAQMNADDEGYERIITALKTCVSSTVTDEHRDEEAMKKICTRFTPDKGDWDGKDWDKDLGKDLGKDLDKDLDKDQDRETSTEGRQSDECTERASAVYQECIDAGISAEDCRSRYAAAYADCSGSDDREDRESDEHEDRDDERRGKRDGAHMRTLCRRMAEKLDDKRDLDRPDMQRLAGLCKRVKEIDYSNKEIDAEEADILSEKCRMIADKFADKDDDKRDDRVQKLRDRVSDEVSRDRNDDRVDDRDDRMKNLHDRADSLRDRLDRENDVGHQLGPRDYIEDPSTVSLL